jgi:hypothetical protein
MSISVVPKQAVEVFDALSSSSTEHLNTIRALREMLDRKQAGFTREAQEQGLLFEGFEEILPHGLTKGAMATISGPSSCGKTSLALSLAASATRAGRYAVLVDGTGQIFPPALRSFGAHLAHLLLVRIPQEERGHRSSSSLFWATSQVVRSGLFELVVMLGVRRCASTAMRQLQLASEQSSSVLLMVHPSKLPLPGGVFQTRIKVRSSCTISGESSFNSPIAAPTRQYMLEISERGRKAHSTHLAHL